MFPILLRTKMHLRSCSLLVFSPEHSLPFKNFSLNSCFGRQGPVFLTTNFGSGETVEQKTKMGVGGMNSKKKETVTLGSSFLAVDKSRLTNGLWEPWIGGRAPAQVLVGTGQQFQWER